jgi:hypothetical protein
MSILKKLIATAGVFAMASASLVSAPVSAATLNLTNATLPSGHILCVIADGGLSTSGTNTTSGASLTATKDGTRYTIVLVNSNSCANATAANTSAASTFFAYTNHSTQLAIGTITPGTSAAVPVFTATPTYANAIPVYNGENTINVCLGNTNAYSIVFTDSDNDTLVENADPTFTASQAFVTSTNAAGSITYTVQPQTQAYSTLNNTFTVAFSVREEALTNVIAAPFGAPLLKTITFKTVDACTVAASSKSSSSVSSMSSSSMSSSSATVVASSTVAASSKAPTEVAAAPMADSAKGSTVRTGGNN